MDKDTPIFGTSSLSTLLQDIYTGVKTKDSRIDSLIEEARAILVKSANPGGASIMIPLIKEYLEVSVNNHEQLVKMAVIIQKLITATANGGTGEDDLSAAEMAELKGELKDIVAATKKEIPMKALPKEDVG